jgi:hypothetical protein
MAKQKRKLSKEAEKLLRNFDEAAQRWGWERDQGHDAATIKGAETSYLSALRALTRYVIDLEELD